MVPDKIEHRLLPVESLDGNGRQQRLRLRREQTDVGARSLSDAREQRIAAFHFHLNGRILLISAVYGQLERDLLPICQRWHTYRFVRVNTALVQCVERGA